MLLVTCSLTPSTSSASPVQRSVGARLALAAGYFSTVWRAEGKQAGVRQDTRGPTPQNGWSPDAHPRACLARILMRIPMHIPMRIPMQRSCFREYLRTPMCLPQAQSPN